MATEGGGAIRSGAWVAAGLVGLGLGGAALGALPHAIEWARSGDPTYLADGDGLLYLAWSRGVVLRGDWRISDAIHRPGGPMMHPWLLFVPPARLARALGTGMGGLGVIWRALAGASIPLALYAAIRPTTRRAGVALGLAAFLFCDPGVLFGQLVRREGMILASLAGGGREFLTGVPRILPHLRVVTPGLALPFLLIHYAATLRARLGGGPAWRATAAATFGLLFYAYFYFWTTALLGLAMAAMLDRPGRRLYLVVMAGGLALGAPAIWAGAEARRSTPGDWLGRTDKFVPIGHLDELLWPRVVMAMWAASAWWVFRSRRELAYLWCGTGAGLIGLNHQLVTGLQVENEHWSAAYGISFSLLLAALAAPSLGRLSASGRAARWGLGAILAAQLAAGFGLRWAEATGSEEARSVRGAYERWREDRSIRGLPAGSVVAGEEMALFVAAALSEVRPLSGRLVEFSSAADDAELDERLFLNFYLCGVGDVEARRRAGLPAGLLGWEAAATRSPSMADRQRRRRLGLVDSIWADPRPSIGRFGVGWVVLPAGLDAGWLSGLAVAGPSGPRYRAWRMAPGAGRPGRADRGNAN